MTLEPARARISYKPWGSRDLRPWSQIDTPAAAVGELWFDRAEAHARDPSLLLKILFAKEALSIQVHPDDAYAQASGMANGKTEAWYVLSAKAGAKVGVGLKRVLTEAELGDAIGDGSITDLVDWRSAATGDVFFIPAGTIHAIGAGLVIAEIQQRSDTTFRLFDPGHGRELHIEHAIAVADREPTELNGSGAPLTTARTLLTSCAYFVLERINIPANSRWELHVKWETWFLVVAGSATIGPTHAGVGDAFFAQADRAVIKAGSAGLTILLAYAASVAQPDLLLDLVPQDIDPPASQGFAKAPAHLQNYADLPFRPLEGRL